MNYLLGEAAIKCLHLIDKYILDNLDLREYSHQQFTITNPHFFDTIDSIEKAYWFGFMCADGCVHIRLGNKYEISLELSKKDRTELIKFAQVLGFDPSRIRDRLRFLKNKNGSVSIVEMSVLKFSCRIMGESLIRNGKFGSKSKDSLKKVPKLIKDLVNMAQLKNSDLSKTFEGQIALAWLLGYFDGDGTVYRDRKGHKFSGEIISSSKSLLLDIKKTFSIVNKIGFKDKFQDTYRLALGPELYRLMMRIYPHSMLRKRPDTYK